MKTIQKTDYYKVAIDAIVVEEGFNVRGELKLVDELAKSIATVGQKNAIEGYKVRGEEKFVLTRGHRRLAAIKLANEKYIGKEGYLKEKITHVNVMPGSANEKDRTIGMLLDGEATQPLTNAEMVKGIKRLLDMDIDPKEIVRSLSLTKSTAQAYNLISAAKAPKAVQEMIDSGLISVAKVNALQRKAENKEHLVELVEEFVNNGTEPKPAKLTDVDKLEEVLGMVDTTTMKGAFLKALVNKLKTKASAEDIAKLLK
ncbi:MAG: ParB/Srx family N-terminal domain-containing protein [Nanoarchaeota archaeon]